MVQTFFKSFISAVLIIFFAAGCGKLSNVVDLNFASEDTKSTVKSAPFVGLQAAAGTRTSGQFKLDAGIGNQLSSAVQESGGFKFYGGIQGQVISR